MENRLGNRTTFPNLIYRSLSTPENHDRAFSGYPLLDDGTFPKSPDHSVEAALAHLSLSSPPARDPGADFTAADYCAGGGELSRLSTANLSMNAVDDGAMGFGGAHSDRVVWAKSWAGFRTGSYSAAASQPWLRGGAVESFGSFLQRKKQSGNQPNCRFPILPFSTKSRFFTNYEGHFDGLSSKTPKFFRPNLYLSWDCLSLKDLQGQVVNLAKDQFGCRLLQKKFENPKEDEIEMAVSEVVSHTGELIRDQFGNYLIQKLMKVGNEKQRSRIILSITRTPFQLFSICLNPHGSRAVQKLLQHVTSEGTIAFIVSALAPGAVALSTDPIGHHVIQQCLICFSSEDNKYLLNEIAANCFEIATNKSGCCVLQSCLEHSEGEQRDRLVAEIIANALHLSEDPYGNYVVQQVLDLKIPEATENLLRQLEGNYASLSCNKYASNVVEKCLIESGEEQSSWIIIDLLSSWNVSMLLVDPFGNFVIQSALSVSKG
ncbi:pumilio homolog 12-like isoform X2 [Diospyros lotus]|nr:pumilio homolog 12-like isoform X2 [Diospyros lotus]